MDYVYLLQGYILGISVAATIGVSGVLVLQNMMTGQLSIGMASTFAAALADTTCGAIVVFGLQAVQSVIVAYKSVLTVVTGLFLCALGLGKLFEKIVISHDYASSTHVLSAFGAVYFLAIVDPVSIMDFTALCMGLTFDFSVLKNVYQFILGLFLGSATWWGVLCCLIMFLRHRFSVQTLQRIQHVVGAGIFALGLWTISGIWRI